MAKMGQNRNLESGQESEMFMPAGAADRFAKGRIIGSGRYKKSDLDILGALLSDSESYTLNEVDDILKKFKAEKV